MKFQISTSRKIINVAEAASRREDCQGTVVWTNGCFDLLHVGHLQSLAAAAELGELLIVGVNGDDSVRQLKGLDRPIVPCSERMELIAAVEFVDWVVRFDEPTPVEALSRIKPDVHCKGAEYADGSRPIPERGTVEGYGGAVRFLPTLPGLSTTNRINSIIAGGDIQGPGS